jgi:hypothetical protein
MQVAKSGVCLSSKARWEVGHYMPDVPEGAEMASSNDVTIDDRGLIYLIDRIRGVDIIETSVM